MSKAGQADWIRRYREAGDIYTQAACGCLALVLVDMPEEVKAAAKDIAEQVTKGREIKRASRGMLPPLNCPAHVAVRAAAALEEAL